MNIVLIIKEGSPQVLVSYCCCHVFNIAQFKTTSSLGDPHSCLLISFVMPISEGLNFLFGVINHSLLQNQKNFLH